MDIILLERIEKLGQVGDVVTVKNGYARNFLLPQKKALRATAANKTFFEAQRSEIEAQNLTAKTQATAIAKKMEGLTAILLRQASDSGQLYGSATSRDIAVQIGESGFKLERNQVILDRPIKEIGIHTVRVRLHGEVSLEVSVNVARSAEEAEKQVDDAAKDLFDTKEHAEAAIEELSEAPEAEVEVDEEVAEEVVAEEVAEEAAEDVVAEEANKA
jgi:large subunit ribosomal protein L9